MKKQLLLGAALLAAISAFPQNGKVKTQPVKVVDFAQKLAIKNQVLTNAVEGTGVAQQNAVKPIGPVMNPNDASATTAASTFSITWKPISGSMNIYGVLVSNSKPVQYNNELNAVAFFHRKSSTYQPSPFPTPLGAETGAIVGMVTQDWGKTWDSTCIQNSNTNWARYPQGGIYSATGNTNIANAYIIATGPITQANTALGWTGSYLSSKQLDTVHGARYNNVASTVANAQQFIANTAPYGTAGKFDFPRTDFTSTDDGVVRTLGFIANNVNGSGVSYGWRGARVLKGNFNSGVFNWSGDSIIPPVVINGNSSTGQVIGTPHMAWNESGTVGYVWFIGCRQGATGANRGYQPIVYKTSNSGGSWSLMSGIDFNQVGFAVPVLDHIPSVRSNTALTIPFFNFGEGIDATVDMNDHLHIVSTIVGTAKSHNDSLGYTYNFNNADGEIYSFPHVPGQRPYIYDFMETATGWTVAVIDSMSTEAPGETLGSDGYASNPWDPAGGSGTDKVSSDARIQVSRTTDGKYVVYTWAESDTAFTDNQVKWNQHPDIKARMMKVSTGIVNPNEINVTSPAVGLNPLVASRAQMHYVSAKCAVVSTSASAGIAIGLAMTVSNNQNTPMTQLLSNTHWFTAATLNFDNVSDANISYPSKPGKVTGPVNGVGIAVANLNSTANSVIFPNPASNNASLVIGLKDNTKVKLTVLNAMGQVVKSMVAEGQTGDNTINIDLSGLSSGVYLVSVNVGNATSTKKLIVE